MKTYDDTTAWYILAHAQVTARAALRLLEEFQNPQAILTATPAEWTQRAKLSAKACARLVDSMNTDHTTMLAKLREEGVSLLSLHDPGYPPLLRAIPDPPLVLFVKGSLPPLEQPTIAIVGSRSASPYGRHAAAELAYGLAKRGYAIISGMALGIDAAAHEAALRAAVPTVAVLGCGIDCIYPPEHRQLYQRIAAAGAVVSEFPPGTPPAGKNFPVRNRIISGLALGVIVVEAAEKSGALITVEHAIEQGREVFAVPGSVNSTQSKGSHQLLRDGAKLVESVDDVLEELPASTYVHRKVIDPPQGPAWETFGEGSVDSSQIIATPATSSLNITTAAKPLTTENINAQKAEKPVLTPLEVTILALLDDNPRHVDEIIAISELTPAQVSSTLLMLELKGYALRLPGSHFLKK